MLLKFVCTYNFEFEVKGDLGKMLNKPHQTSQGQSRTLLTPIWFYCKVGQMLVRSLCLKKWTYSVELGNR